MPLTSNLRSLLQAGAVLTLVLVSGCVGLGDPNVVVSSTATPSYSQEKYGNGRPRQESYVFMEGRFVPAAAVDRTLERMSFRALVERVAPELAKQQYLPAKSVGEADLLIVVHWGATNPRLSNDEMRSVVSRAAEPSMEGLGRWKAGPGEGEEVSPGPVFETVITELFGGHNNDEIRDLEFDQLSRETMSLGGDMGDDAVRLLGYARHLRRLADRPFVSTEEEALRMDLSQERYFVILRAYDLRKMVGRRPPVAWTLHLNMRSPGQNFATALNRMSVAAVNYFGKQTDTTETVLPMVREGHVKIGEVTIVGER